ncbi:MAG: hypothetical protein J6S67_15085 [Methanobrevibacter sp.]|nr:hypothetical protein [Methanobrevibacter sp.]
MYESKIFVVMKSDTKGWDENVKDYFMCEEIATFKLCGIDSDILAKIKSFPDSDCYIWDGENPTVTDKYGDRLKEIPLGEAVKIFGYASAVHDYRRYEPCASLLRGFNPQEWENLVVLHFGY